jgi:hypothetical protein
MSITGVSPVEAGPKPALSEAEGMTLRLGSQTRKNAFGDPLMGKMPMLRTRGHSESVGGMIGSQRTLAEPRVVPV